jgi:hypothetical protein
MGVNAFNNSYITLTSVPQNVAANPSTNATFSVSAISGYLGDPAGVPAPPISYQWQSLPFGAQLFANINGATSTSYTTPILSSADDGSQYRAVLTTAGNFTNSPAARLRIGELQFTQASINSGQFTLQWTGNGVLLESTNVTGPWSVSANQNNPQTVSVTGMKFYRLRQ